MIVWGIWWGTFLCLGIGEASRLRNFRGHVHHIQYHPDEKQNVFHQDQFLNVQERYFDQAIVDHFAPVSEQRYWKQRYFINDEFWGGASFPVFLYIGMTCMDSNIYTML